MNTHRLEGKKPGLHCCKNVQPDAGIVANSAQPVDFVAQENFRKGHKAALPLLGAESLSL